MTARIHELAEYRARKAGKHYAMIRAIGDWLRKAAHPLDEPMQILCPNPKSAFRIVIDFRDYTDRHPDIPDYSVEVNQSDSENGPTIVKVHRRGVHE